MIETACNVVTGWLGSGKTTLLRHVLEHGLDSDCAMFAAVLADDFSCQLDGAIEPSMLRGWSQRTGVRLPQACERLLEYIASVVAPVQSAAVMSESQGASAEREVILGAALQLVTRFPDQCRDDNGFFDGQHIAALMLEKAALWFPLEPPTLDRDAIAELLERYLT